jgi:hypothetical protein
VEQEDRQSAITTTRRRSMSMPNARVKRRAVRASAWTTC